MRWLVVGSLLLFLAGCQAKSLSVENKLFVPEVKQTPIIIAKRKFNHSLKITSKYDRFKDETKINISDVIYKRLDKKIRINNLMIVLMVEATTKGQKSNRPETVTFIFFVAGAKENYIDNPELLVLADDQRINLGVFESKLFDTQYLTKDVSTDDFLRIVASEKVEMRLGQREFALTREQLEGLRDFASRFHD